MSPLSRDARELIARVRRGDALPEPVRRRAGTRAAATIAVSATTAAATAGGAKAAAAAVAGGAAASAAPTAMAGAAVVKLGVSAFAVKLAVVSAVAVAAVAAPVAWQRAAREPERQQVAPPAPQVHAAAPRAPAVPAPAVAPPARVPRPAEPPPVVPQIVVDVFPQLEPTRARSLSPRIAPARPPEPDAVLVEAELLRSALVAEREGDSARALALLDEHGRRFAAGQLVAERELAQMRTLCTQSRIEDAMAKRARFLRDHADSPLASRVRSFGCGSSLDGSSPPPPLMGQ